MIRISHTDVLVKNNLVINNTQNYSKITLKNPTSYETGKN